MRKRQRAAMVDNGVGGEDVGVPKPPLSFAGRIRGYMKNRMRTMVYGRYMLRDFYSINFC
jgi:hypothetical protein